MSVCYQNLMIACEDDIDNHNLYNDNNTTFQNCTQHVCMYVFTTFISTTFV